MRLFVIAFIISIGSFVYPQGSTSNFESFLELVEKSIESKNSFINAVSWIEVLDFDVPTKTIAIKITWFQKVIGYDAVEKSTIVKFSNQDIDYTRFYKESNEITFNAYGPNCRVIHFRKPIRSKEVTSKGNKVENEQYINVWKAVFCFNPESLDKERFVRIVMSLED